MATPLDGQGNAPYFATWGSIFDFLRWERLVKVDDEYSTETAEATTEEQTLIVTGKNHIYFFIRLELNQPYLEVRGTGTTLPWINRDYYSEFVGKMITPSGQDWPPVVDPRGFYEIIACPPFAITDEIFDNPQGLQFIEQPPPGPPYPQKYYFNGIDEVEGFTDQT
jgi:hypothetical protein